MKIKKLFFFLLIIIGLNISHFSFASDKEIAQDIGIASSAVVAISLIVLIIKKIKYLYDVNKEYKSLKDSNYEDALTDLVQGISKTKEGTLLFEQQQALTEKSSKPILEPLLSVDRFKEFFKNYNEAITNGNTQALKKLTEDLHDYFDENGFTFDQTDILTAIKPFIQEANHKFTDDVIETLKNELPARAELEQEVRLSSSSIKTIEEINKAKSAEISKALDGGIESLNDYINDKAKKLYGDLEVGKDFVRLLFDDLKQTPEFTNKKFTTQDIVKMTKVLEIDNVAPTSLKSAVSEGIQGLTSYIKENINKRPSQEPGEFRTSKPWVQLSPENYFANLITKEPVKEALANGTLKIDDVYTVAKNLNYDAKTLDAISQNIGKTPKQIKVTVPQDLKTAISKGQQGVIDFLKQLKGEANFGVIKLDELIDVFAKSNADFTRTFNENDIISIKKQLGITTESKIAELKTNLQNSINEINKKYKLNVSKEPNIDFTKRLQDALTEINKTTDSNKLNTLFEKYSNLPTETLTSAKTFFDQFKKLPTDTKLKDLVLSKGGSITINSGTDLNPKYSIIQIDKQGNLFSRPQTQQEIYSFKPMQEIYKPEVLATNIENPLTISHFERPITINPVSYHSEPI